MKRISCINYRDEFIWKVKTKRFMSTINNIVIGRMGHTKCFREMFSKFLFLIVATKIEKNGSFRTPSETNVTYSLVRSKRNSLSISRLEWFSNLWIAARPYVPYVQLLLCLTFGLPSWTKTDVISDIFSLILVEDFLWLKYFNEKNEIRGNPQQKLERRCPKWRLTSSL